MRPDGCAARQVQAVHGDLYYAVIDFREHVMVIHFLALERIVRGSFNRISVRSRTARDEISDAAVLMAFVVVHMSGENDNPGTEALLPRFQSFGEFVLRGTG